MATDPTVSPQWFAACYIPAEHPAKPKPIWTGRQGQPSWEAAYEIAKSTANLIQGVGGRHAPCVAKKRDRSHVYYIIDVDKDGNPYPKELA